MNIYLDSKMSVINTEDKTVLMNPISGKIIKITTRLEYNKEGHYIDIDSKRVIDKLTELKFTKTENSVISVESQDKYLTSLYIMTTLDCNLNCNFCILSSNKDFKRKKCISSTDLESMFNKLNGYKIGTIVLTGGQPILNNELFSMLDLCKSRFPDSKIILCTNGTLLTEEIIRRISNIIYKVEISWESIYYEYEELREEFMKKMEILSKYNIKKTFSYVITPNNKLGIYEFIDKCVYYNVTPLFRIVNNVNQIKSNNFTQKEVITIYRDIFKHIINNKYDEKCLENIINISFLPKLGCCVIKKDVLCLCPDGDIYVCPNLLNEEYKLGNINEEKDISSIVKNIDRFLIDTSDFYIDNDDYCKECEVRYICGGECIGLRKKKSERYPNTCKYKMIFIKFMLLYYKKDASFISNIKLLNEILDEELELLDNLGTN